LNITLILLQVLITLVAAGLAFGMGFWVQKRSVTRKIGA